MQYRNLWFMVFAVICSHGCVTKYQPDLSNREAARLRVVSTYPQLALWQQY